MGRLSAAEVLERTEQRSRNASYRGYKARSDGAALSENPYNHTGHDAGARFNEPLRKAWDEGWKRADAELTKGDQ